MKTYLILIENSVYVYLISIGLILFDTTIITRKENVFAIAIQIRNENLNQDRDSGFREEAQI